MANNKQFEIVLNLLTKIDYDKGKVNALFSELQTIATKNKVDLGVNQDGLKTSLKTVVELVNQISANAKKIDLNVDSSKLLKDFDKVSAEIEKIIGSDLGKAFEGIDLSKLEQELTNSAKALENVDLTELEDAIANLDTSKVFGDEFQSSIKATKDKIGTLETSLEQMVAEGKKGTPEFAKMEKELKLAVLEANKMDDALKNVANEAKTAESFVDRMAKFGLASQGINAVASGLNDLSQPFVALDTATQNLKTLGDEAAAMAPNLRAAALIMSKDLPFAASEIQTAMFDALASGVKGGEEGLKSFADTAAKLAIGGGSELSAATSVLAGQLNAYGESADQAAKYSDTLFNIVNYGVTSIPELSTTLANVVPTASSLGVELDNVGAALATMTSKGIPTAQSTTKLNALLIELAKPGAALAPILTKAGVSLESLKQDDLPVTLGKINAALKATGKASIEVFSSSEAGAAFASLAGDVEGFAQTFNDVKNTTGSAQNAYNQMADSIEVRTKQIQTKVEALLIGGFDKLGSSFTVVAKSATALAPTATALVGLGQALPIDKLKEFGAQSATQFSKFGTSILGSLKSVDGFKQGVAGASGGFANLAKSGVSSISSMGSSLANFAKANPFLLVAGALAVFLTQTEKGQEILSKLGDKGKELLQKLQPVVDFFQTVLFAVFDGAGELVGAFVDTLGSVIESIFEIVSAIGEMTGITDLFKSLFSTVDTGKSSFDGTTDAIGALVDILKLLPLAISLYASVISGVFQNLPELISAFVEYAKIELNPANWFGTDSEAETKAKQNLSNVMDKVLSGAKDKISAYKLGDALDKSLESKKKLDKSAELEKLTKDFAKAGNEIARGDIATKIAELAPDAVKGYKSIVNAQGEVIQVADINIAKANELAEAQKKSASSEIANAQKAYSKTLEDQANAYDKAKTKAGELAKKIVEDGKKGIDTKASVKEYESLQNELAKKSKDINKTLSDATKANFTIGEVKLPESVKTDFAENVNKVVKSPEVIAAGKGIEDVLKLKGEIGSEFSLTALQEKLKNAKTDVEKSNISKAIAAQAPDAVKAIGTVVDEQGNLITKYEVAGDKVKEYATKAESALKDKIVKAQGEVQKSLTKEAQSYEDLKNQAVKKQQEINEARAKGYDTAELEKQAKGLNDKLNTSGTELLTTLAKAKNAGVENTKGVEVLASQLGKTPDEVKKLISAQAESIKKGAEQVQSASQLAAEFDKAKSGVDALVKTQVSALAEINSKLKDKSVTKEQKEQLEQQRAEFIKNGKEAVAQQKNLEKANKEAEKALGIGLEKGKTKAEQLKAEYDILKAKSDLELQTFKNIQDSNILAKGRKRTSADDLALNQKSLELTEKLSVEYDAIALKKKLVTGIKDGILQFESKVKAVDKQDILKTREDAQTKINADQNAKIELIAKAKLDEKEIQSLKKDIENQKFQAELELGIITPDILAKINLDKLKSDAIELNKEIAENSLKVQSDASKENLTKQKELNEKKLSNEKAQKDLLKSEYDRQITNIRDLEKQKLDAIQSGLDKQLSQYEQFLVNYNNLAQGKDDQSRDKRLATLEEEQKNELKVLERYKELGTISEQEFTRKSEELTAKSAQRKADTEAEFAKRAIVLQQLAEGQKIADQNKAEAEKAKIQIDARQQELELLQKTIGGDKDKFEQLTELQRKFNSDNEAYLKDSLNAEKKAQRDKAKLDLETLQKSAGLSEVQRKALEENINSLDLAQKTFTEKGNLLTTLGAELSNDVSGAISGIFAGGGTEAILDNARKLFATIGGIIQKEIQAFVLRLVLSEGTLKYLSALPFPLNIAAVPVISTTINASVKAFTDPILQDLLAFPTGGRIDKPTLAMVGDGAKLGMPNREWIFNDPQLIATVQMATAGANLGLIQEIRELKMLLSSQQLTTTIKGTDIRVALNRTNQQMAQVSR